ncbi:MAG TPA: formate dehydrogenase subunit gamma [Dehalococcoidia bacterium]
MNGAKGVDLVRAQARIDELKDMAGALLPILLALQEEFGYIDRDLIPVIADAVNQSRAEVVGVINFYHDFRQQPPGRHILEVCRAEACQAVGCEEMIDDIQSRLGVRTGQTAADGSVTLREVFCLGNCALGPSAMVDGNLYGRMSADRIQKLLAEASK